MFPRMDQTISSLSLSLFYVRPCPPHSTPPPVPVGLDIYSLKELALSQDGKRLIVTNPGDEQEEIQDAEDDDVVGYNNGAAGPRGSLSSNGTDMHPSSSARNTPPQRLHGGRTTTATFSSSSSSAAPLVPRRHMALLLRLHGKHGGRGGDGDRDNATAVKLDKVN